MEWFFNLFRRKPKPKPPAPKPAPSTSDYRATLLELHKLDRATNGLGPLVLSTKLTNSAQFWANWMAKNDEMVHETPVSTLRSRIEGAGYVIWTAGENIAEGFLTPEALMTAWMNSPGHYANIMNTNFVDVGFGMATDSSGVPFWCADFGKSPVPGLFQGVSPTVISLAGPLRRISMAGIAVPTGFSAGSQTTSSHDASIKYATLTDGDSNELIGWYKDSGTNLYCIDQMFDNQEPLPPPVPGDPIPPPVPPSCPPILPGITVPTLSTDTNGSVTTYTDPNTSDVYYHRDSTRGVLTMREWFSAATGGYVYAILVTFEATAPPPGD